MRSKQASVKIPLNQGNPHSLIYPTDQHVSEYFATSQVPYTSLQPFYGQSFCSFHLFHQSSTYFQAYYAPYKRRVVDYQQTPHVQFAPSVPLPSYYQSTCCQHQADLKPREQQYGRPSKKYVNSSTGQCSDLKRRREKAQRKYACNKTPASDKSAHKGHQYCAERV